MAFNLSWMAIWLVSLVAARHGTQVAYFPLWFFAVGMITNLFAHPALALLNRGYFPGLFTSPLVGLMGLLVARRLARLTKSGRSGNPGPLTHSPV